jgi:hypothetical protein
LVRAKAAGFGGAPRDAGQGRRNPSLSVFYKGDYYMPNFTRVMFIRHKQKELLQLDFSECAPEELLIHIKKARDIITQQPPNSMRIITNLTDLRVNKDTVKILKEYIELNKSFVLASAVFGVSAQTKVLFNTVITLARRDIRLFDTEEAAKDWLAEQK